jgi:hypothetical protein
MLFVGRNNMAMASPPCCDVLCHYLCVLSAAAHGICSPAACLLQDSRVQPDLFLYDSHVMLLLLDTLLCSVLPVSAD